VATPPKKVHNLVLQFQEDVRRNFGGQAVSHFAENEVPCYKELLPLYKDHCPTLAHHYEQRMQTYQELNITPPHARYNMQSYTLSSAAQETICAVGDKSLYTSCYGTALQQVVHQECIDIVEQAVAFDDDSPLYLHQDALLECAHAACAYNQDGLMHKAITIADFCWVLFDCGHAALEGAWAGAAMAVTDMIEHPFQTALTVAAGKYVLAYHLSKVLYDVGCISITAYFDPEKGAQEWNDYIAPVNNLINALNTNQIGIRDAIKGATQCAIGWKAQTKLFGGLNKLYTNARNKAIAYAQQYSSASPEQYLATPEGLLLKSSYNIDKPEKLKDRLIQKMSEQKNKGSQAEKLPKASVNTGILHTFSLSDIEAGVNYIMNDPNSLHHIFAKLKHKLNPLVEKLGNQENVVRFVVKELSGKVPFNGIFKDVKVNVGGYDVYVRGRVMDGIPKIGTFFIE
jgi:hypothetical protein